MPESPGDRKPGTGKDRKGGEGFPPAPAKGLLFWLIAAAALALVVSELWRGGSRKIELSDALSRISAGQVARVVLRDDAIVLVLKEPKGETLQAYVPPAAIESFSKRLEDLHAQGKIEGYQYDPSSQVTTLFMNLLLPLLIFGLIYFLLLRSFRAPGGPAGILTFGKSRATLISKQKTGVTFADVAGMEEAKEEVQEIIEFLRSPQKFQRIGGRIPRGVLLVGPPGTGKTLLAKAIAGEAGVPFFGICGSDFVEMFVGVGASRVRDLFKTAKEKSPCIIFLDEIDAVGRLRGTGLGGGHDEREQTLNAILVEMDGFETDSQVIVIAATNRPDILDPALLRPGRFDREVVIDLPDFPGRLEILKVHARKVKLEAAVDLSVIARSTTGYSGADLEAVINEAALAAALHGQEAVAMGDLLDARDKVKWGRKKKSRMRGMEEEDKRITAYHESGHAITAKLIPGTEPIQQVSIIPMGRSLGHTLQMPEKDRYHMQRRKILAMLSVLFGGRVAEELFCGDISTGAQDDIDKATDLARRMICEWGMSERLGPVKYAGSEEHLFLGREIARSERHAQSTAQEIDAEIRRVLDNAYKRTRQVLESHRSEMERLADALVQFETLDGDEVDMVLRGESLESIRRRKQHAAANGGGPGTAPAQA